MKTLKVIFVESEYKGNPCSKKLYDYAAPTDLPIEIHEHVVVEANDQYKVCRVVQIVSYETENVTKQIVCKVDDKGYKDRLVNEARRAEILGAMKALERKRLQMKKFEELAQNDPEATQLLNEYKSLA